MLCSAKCAQINSIQITCIQFRSFVNKNIYVLLILCNETLCCKVLCTNEWYLWNAQFRMRFSHITYYDLMNSKLIIWLNRKWVLNFNLNQFNPMALQTLQWFIICGWDNNNNSKKTDNGKMQYLLIEFVMRYHTCEQWTLLQKCAQYTTFDLKRYISNNNLIGHLGQSEFSHHRFRKFNNIRNKRNFNCRRQWH